MNNIIIPNEIIENKIYFIRNFKVMIDLNLVILYNIDNKQLKR